MQLLRSTFDAVVLSLLSYSDDWCLLWLNLIWTITIHSLLSKGVSSLRLSCCAEEALVWWGGRPLQGSLR